MSLQVWLPLNGDLHNQGLSPQTVTITTTPIWAPLGKIGNSALYTKTQMTTMNFPNLAGVSTYSVSYWLYIPTATAHTAWSDIFGIQFNCGDTNTWERDERRAATTTGRHNYHLAKSTSEGSNTNAYYGTREDDNANDAWAHYTLVKNDTNARLFVNGQLVATISAANFENTPRTMTGQVSLGQDGCEAYLQDFRIYDHALSPKEVEEIAKGLVLHYKLDGETQIQYMPGYQPLEYIESAGSSWLNTGYIFNPETDAFKVVFQGNDTSNNGMIFASNGSKYTWLYYYSAGMRIYMTNSSGSQTSIAGPKRDTNKHAAIYQNKHYYFDGVDKGSLSGSYVSDTNSIYLFAYTGNGTNYAFKGRIYSVEIMRNSIIQKIFMPAKQLSDNAIGMYEVLSKSFIPSMTATAFTAGPNVPITGTIYDSSGYSNNGTIVGSLTAAAPSPRYGIATQFPGTAYSKCTSPSLEARTVSVWVRWDSIPSGQSVIYVDYKSKTGLGLMSTGILCSSCGLNSYVFSKSSIVANTWYHFVVVSPNGAADATRKLYINGVEQTATSNTSNWSYTIDELQVGKRSTTSDGFAGEIVDFRIYTTALTADQIKELYNTSMSIDSNGNVYARELVEL